MRPNHPKDKPKTLANTFSDALVILTEVVTGLGLLSLGLAKGVWTRAFVGLWNVAGGVQYI